MSATNGSNPRLDRIERLVEKFERTNIDAHAEIREFQRRTDQNLAEITDKLNGLIGFVVGR